MKICATFRVVSLALGAVMIGLTTIGCDRREEVLSNTLRYARFAYLTNECLVVGQTGTNKYLVECCELSPQEAWATTHFTNGQKVRVGFAIVSSLGRVCKAAPTVSLDGE